MLLILSFDNLLTRKGKPFQSISYEFVEQGVPKEMLCPQIAEIQITAVASKLCY